MKILNNYPCRLPAAPLIIKIHPRIFIINIYIKFSLWLAVGFFCSAGLASTNYGAVGVRNPLLAFDITDDGVDTRSASGSALHYAPKMPTIIGIETSIKSFTLGYSTTLSRSEAKEEQKFTDYNLNYYLDSIGIDAIYSEFLGFRLTSAEKLDLTSIPTDEKFRKDFAIKTTNVNLYYFPIRFGWSLNRSLDPSESEQTTGIGIGVLASYNSVGIDTKHGAIPQAFQSTFGQDGSLLRGSFESSSLSGALAGTIALRPLFFSVMATSGSGQQSQKYEVTNTSRSNKGIASRQSLIGLLGFSNKILFAALQVSSEAPRYVLRDLSLRGTHTEMALKVGFKF